MQPEIPVTRREVNTALLAVGAMAAMPVAVLAQETRVLPAPRKETGKPLMQALQLRRSIREYSQRPLSAQALSELLWAAYGVNRPSGDRTAPYWRHIMVIDIYAAMADGVWLYDPRQHALRHISAPTFGRRRASRTSSRARRSISSTWSKVGA